MRLTRNTRVRRAFVVVCGLACTFVPATAAAATPATSATAQSVTARLAHSNVNWGQAVHVRGTVSGGAAVQPVALQFRAQGRHTWRTVAHTKTAHRAYRFSTRVPGRGSVRVVLGDGSAQALRSTAGAVAPATVASRSHAVRVHAVLRFHTRRVDVSAGRSVLVTGHVLPRRAGRLVVLQQRNGHHWARVARSRTDRHGNYRLAYRPRHTAVVRVATGTDALASGTARSAGHVHVLHDAVASRYDDYGGPLACSNGHLGYSQLGVAHKSLPCGTKVTIHYHGRSVTVPVIDRGPYSAGRDFDLTGATARRLHFNGVDTIQVSY